MAAPGEGGSDGGCPTGLIDHEHLDYLRSLTYSLSTAGICLGAPLVLTKLCIAEERRFPSRLSLFFVLGCLSLNIAILTGWGEDWDDAWTDVYVKKRAPSPFCMIQGVCFQFLASALMWIWVSISVTMYLVVCCQISFLDIKRYEFRIHVFWVGLSALQTIIPFSLNPAEPQLGAPYCWLTEKNGWVYQIAFFHSEMFLSLVIGLVLIARVLRCYVEISRVHRGTFDTVMHTYVVRHSIFIFFFASVFIALVLFLVNQVLDKRGVWCVRFPMAVSHVCAASGVGIYAFVVFGLTRRNLKFWFGRCFPNQFKDHVVQYKEAKSLSGESEDAVYAYGETASVGEDRGGPGAGAISGDASTRSSIGHIEGGFRGALMGGGVAGGYVDSGRHTDNDDDDPTRYAEA